MTYEMPQSVEAEETVIGAILLHPRQCVAEVMGRVTPDDFYHPGRREIFAAVAELDATSQPIDLITVRDRLVKNGKAAALEQLGGINYLALVQGRVVTVENIGYHAASIAAKAQRRRWIETAARIRALGLGDTDDASCDEQIESLAFETSKAKRVASDPQPMPVVMRDVERFMHEQGEKEAEGKTLGVATKLTAFDTLTTGLQPSDLVIIAARPSMGKSALAMELVANAASDGTPCLVFSREMTSRALGLRMVASRSGLNSMQIRTGRVHSVASRSAASRAINDLAQMPVHIHDASNFDFPQLRSLARRWWTKTQSKTGLGMIVVDYLQLLNWGGKIGQREQEIAKISGGLKDIARELQIPVVALAQLNRGVESREDKRPMLSDLRESGAIEQDADLIAFLYRDEVYHPQSQDRGVAEIIIGKQRNGPTGTVRVGCDMSTGRFTNLERGSL